MNENASSLSYNEKVKKLRPIFEYTHTDTHIIHSGLTTVWAYMCVRVCAEVKMNVCSYVWWCVWAVVRLKHTLRLLLFSMLIVYLQLIASIRILSSLIVIHSIHSFTHSFTHWPSYCLFFICVFYKQFYFI